MAGHTSISPEDLFARMGTRDQPLIVDVCIPDDFAEDPRHIPASAMVNHHAAAAGDLPDAAGRDVVIVCHKGLKLSEGVAAHLRARGVSARHMTGGRVGWVQARLPMIPQAAMPQRDGEGRRVWVTRVGADMAVLATCWLIRRFADPHAVFLFVSDAQIEGVAEKFGATPLTAFGAMIEAFGLAAPALKRLGGIVHGAAPESAGLAAIAAGLSRLCHDDTGKLETALPLLDALHLWCRDDAHAGQAA